MLIEQAMREFLALALECEDLDRSSTVLGSKADFAFHERRVVFEIKTLTDDRRVALTEVLRKWRSRSDFPYIPGEFSIGDLKRLHPRGEAFIRDIVRVLAHPIETAIKKANRQIRETKKSLGWRDGGGVVLLLNENVSALDPELVGAELGRLLRQMDGPSQYRYESVDSVIAVFWSHHMKSEDGDPQNVVMFHRRESIDSDAAGQCFEREFIKHWAEFMRQDLLSIGSVKLDAAGLGSLQFRPRRRLGPIDLGPGVSPRLAPHMPIPISIYCPGLLIAQNPESITKLMRLLKPSKYV